MKRILFLLLVVSALFSFSAVAATNNAWIDPATITVSPQETATLNVKTNSDADVSSVEIIGSFDPARITPTFTPTLTGKDGAAWSPTTAKATKPTPSTFKLQASTLGGAGNFLPAGTQSVLQINFRVLAEDPTIIQITSVKVNNVAVSNLASATITVQAGQQVTACTAANWQMGAWSSCVGACGSQGTQTRTVTKSGDCQGGAAQPAASQSCTPACPPDMIASKKQQLITQVQNIPENEVPSSWTAQFISRLAGILKSIFG